MIPGASIDAAISFLSPNSSNDACGAGRQKTRRHRNLEPPRSTQNEDEDRESSLPHLRIAATTINQSNHQLHHPRPPLLLGDSTRIEAQLLPNLLGKFRPPNFLQMSLPNGFPNGSSLTLASRKSTSTHQNPKHHIGAKISHFHMKIRKVLLSKLFSCAL